MSSVSDIMSFGEVASSVSLSFSCLSLACFFSIVCKFPNVETNFLASSIENALPSSSGMFAGILMSLSCTESNNTFGKSKSRESLSETLCSPLIAAIIMEGYSKCNKVPNLFAFRFVSKRFVLVRKYTT